MAITFMLNKQTQYYDVIGPADELKIGPVVATRKSGVQSNVVVVKLSSTFVGKYGDNTGKTCVIGTLAPEGFSQTATLASKPDTSQESTPF